MDSPGHLSVGKAGEKRCEAGQCLASRRDDRALGEPVGKHQALQHLLHCASTIVVRRDQEVMQADQGRMVLARDAGKTLVEEPLASDGQLAARASSPNHRGRPDALGRSGMRSQEITQAAQLDSLGRDQEISEPFHHDRRSR